MLRRHSLSRRIKDYHRAVYKEFDFSIGNFVITPFEVLHDGTDNCGFLSITDGPIWLWLRISVVSLHALSII